MKFGKELKASIVQAWRNKYVRYALIKSKLKELKRLYEEHNIPLKANQLNLDQLPQLINKESALKLDGIDIDGVDGITYDKSREEFERYMDGLHNDHNMIEFVNNNDNDTIIETSESNEPLDNNINKKSKYRFSKVAEIVEAHLDCKMPPFPAEFQDIKLKEREIILILETDIFTVSKFYAEQCQYFAEQHNALILRVELLCEDQLDLDTQKEDDVYTRKMNLRQSVLSNVKQTTLSDTESELDEDQQQTKVSTKDITEQKSNLRVLFRQMYNALRMLEKYREINFIAFQKITKKHDKNSGRFKNLQEITMKLIKTRCNFGNDYFTQFLQKRLEYLYGSYLKPSDQKAGEALERLRHPPSTKQIQTESCIIGLCGGWSIAMLLISIILVFVSTLSVDFWSSWSVYRSWYIFRASIAMSVYLWLWGCDLWVFQKYQFNHAFIFGADPTTLMRVPHVWNIAAIFSVTTMLFIIFFVLSFMFDDIFNIDPEIFAMMSLFCWIAYIIIPFPWIKYTKRFLMKSLFKQIISPFSNVEFIDFFLADQWTSLFTLVVDLLFSFCYLFTGDFLLSGDEQSASCDSVKTKAWLSLLKLVPYWIRFWQCIRRARDKHRSAKSTKWHCANAGKYSCAILVTFINAFHVYYNSKSTKYLSFVFGAAATLYAYSWDIYKDWGLFRYKANKQHKILRKELTYPAYSYYVAMLVNLICRIAWAVSLFPASFGIYDISMMHFLKLPLNIAEIMRRCMWNLFRIENEHLNNCGEFRVIKDIPIAHNYVSVIKIRSPKKTSDYKGNNRYNYNDNDEKKIELHQIEEEQEVKDDIDDDMMISIPRLPTQQRTNTFSDRPPVINIENKNKNNNDKEILRNVIITRPQSNDKSNESERDSSSSAHAQSRRRRTKPRGRKGYISVKTHYFDDENEEEEQHYYKKRKRRKKKKKNKKRKKRKGMNRAAEGQQTLIIKRVKTDEMSSSSEGYHQEIEYRKKRRDNKFIRIRGDPINDNDSSHYSQDSEVSESGDSFTNRTWPKRIEIKDIKHNKKRKEFSENKIRDKKRYKKKRTITENTTTTTNTDNTTEIVFKPKMISTNLTEENLKIMEEQKVNDDDNDNRKSRKTMDDDDYKRNTKITRNKARINNNYTKSTQKPIGLISNPSSIQTKSNKMSMMMNKEHNSIDNDNIFNLKMHDK